MEKTPRPSAPKKHQTDLKCQHTVYITPERILEPVRRYFEGPIPLDPATQPDNPTGALAFCTEQGPDGLLHPWHLHDGTFVNPPYGKVISTWCEKIHEEAVLGTTILALLPCGARFATRYFQDFILSEPLDATCFISPRVKFTRPDGTGTSGSNPYDSMLLGFNVELGKFKDCFGHLGRVLRMEVV